MYTVVSIYASWWWNQTKGINNIAIENPESKLLYVIDKFRDEEGEDFYLCTLDDDVIRVPITKVVKIGHSRNA